jgi:DNA polymerase II large subunit
VNVPADVAMSEEMAAYFKGLLDENARCYEIATRARRRGRDPEIKVEIPQAEDLASRVEELLSDYDVKGVAEDIRRLTKEHGNREIVSLMIAKEIANKPAPSMEIAIDRAVRVGLAVLTEGILVAPLEGIAATKLKRNDDGSSYVDLVFAGPIRAAGGTAQAMSVLIADVVRQALNIGKYIPTEGEISRFDEEIPLYKQAQHLQYVPTSKEIDLIVRNCPVCIDGEGTEDVEISGFRDLPRMETNKVRGGACLVIAEGLCQKAAKIEKHVKKLELDGWHFITEYLEAHKKAPADEGAVKVKVVEPTEKYIKDIVAGRPIFGHPSAVGGFRLRYGRARTSGLASLAFNPASMYAMDDFMALGTQVKIERPGKACVVTPCDRIDGPTFLLKNGDLVYCATKDEVLEVRNSISEIVDNGEILVPYGEFCENNHMLVPCGYPIEWHKQELLAKGPLPENWESPSYEEAKSMSRTIGVPLHPNYNMFWYDVPLDRLRILRSAVLANGRMEGGRLRLPREPVSKRILEDLCALHNADEGNVLICEKLSLPLIEGLGLGTAADGSIVETAPLSGADSLSAVSAAMGIEVRAKARTRIGTRMARPEKAKDRKLAPVLHAVFPVGKDPDAHKEILQAITASKKEVSATRGSGSREPTISVNTGQRICRTCKEITFRSWCRTCGNHTYYEEKPRTMGNDNLVKINLEAEYKAALELLNERSPGEIKCLDVMISKTKVPEDLEKGILRVKNDVTTFKDGTIRFDMTDIPITHFRPREIELSIEKAHKLGYTHDWNGDPLTDPEQICELKVQDILPARDCGDFMVKVSKFIDDELEEFYELPRYYNINDRTELIGQLAIGLAPHTSGGILCRIIGYTTACGCLAHPFFHAAKRRNCDGDEDSIMLMLDGLINFSRAFLSNRRGGLMDAPLVLTTRLDPNEIDKEAHNVDCHREYPLLLYQAAMEMRDPKEIEKDMDLVAGRIGTPLQYEGFGFTHDTADVSEGPKHSAYTTLESMRDKMDAQLALGKKIRAVDEKDVASRVINKHLMPDMIGNLRSFSAQTVRCTRCGEKYRRIPLSGRCTCGNGLTLTVYEASVKKYLAVSKEMSEKYGVDNYTRERIAILEMSMDSVFNNDKIKKCKLSDFF